MNSRKDIVKTIQKHIETNWSTTEIDFAEVPFKEKGKKEWIQLKTHLYPSEPKRRGENIDSVTVYLNIFVKQGTSPLRIHDLADLAHPLFHQYDLHLLSGNGTIRFQELQERFDGNVPRETADLLQLSYFVEGSVENV